MYLLKWLFALESLGLSATTIVGIVIGLRHPKRGKIYAIVLGAGIVVPVALIAI